MAARLTLTRTQSQLYIWYTIAKEDHSKQEPEGKEIDHLTKKKKKQGNALSLKIPFCLLSCSLIPIFSCSP